MAEPQFDQAQNVASEDMRSPVVAPTGTEAADVRPELDVAPRPSQTDTPAEIAEAANSATANPAIPNSATTSPSGGSPSSGSSALVSTPKSSNPFSWAWNGAMSQVSKLLPIESVSSQIVQWFTVSEDQVAEILQTVRQNLPTTEALLIGKPQAGKSSIVRGLTGVSAEIVGQGFKPHTQHTQRYSYPNADVPLLVFTDTVGLGDVNRDTEAILQELTAELRSECQGARVLILTVKVTDFAVDSLKAIAAGLRKQFPSIPCLLVATCAHELYPSLNDNHPDYPPQFDKVQRAFAALQETFKGLCDRAVLIDFTLEEDGYDPVFYGLDAFRDVLADLLPEAESRAIHRLIDEQDGIGDQLGNLYRDVGRRYISAFAVIAATLAAVPLPFATMPVLTALQISMVSVLGKLYGQVLTPSQAGGVVSAIAGGFLAQAIGRELIKFLPGFGSVIAASWAAAYTWALGEGACAYFGDLMGGKKPDPQKIQAVMDEAFKAAKERFKGGVSS
ncbi:GTPase family protein [Leptolyngbya sp. AN02str]|uniref:GTPase family protein n=1 Tax=Leptolyngbya sp. AN02str TaxID=3423363 RepID=UPI003D310308